MEKSNLLAQFGFSHQRGSHTSRTMMLEEMRSLLEYVSCPEADKGEYFRAIVEENCLGKRSGKNRVLTYTHLVTLYSLDCTKVLFRALRYFWNRDSDGQPLIALLCTYARDSIFRSSAPFILKFSEGAIITRRALEEFIDDQAPGHFSKSTLQSTAQNINSTWTKSGHLNGRARKVRSRAKATPGSVSYALLLSYLTGARGQFLFQTEYVKLLDFGFDEAIECAEEASRKGWIVFKRIGGVIEVSFPNLITPKEMEWLREQN